MNFYSTNNKEHQVSFREAVFNSMPQDKGLYMPMVIPQVDKDFIENIEQYSFSEIAFKVAATLLDGAIPADALKKIVEETVNFPAPVVQLDEDLFVLELFHGPSLAFKDFGARFMSRVMSYYRGSDDSLLDVLVATSGDTGGAVALGFLGVPGTRVTILYPKGKVSNVQELQLTTNGENIRAIEIDGSFDDCQALVKQAFTDPELNRQLQLTSANSINIARLVPQMFYYFNAYAQLKKAGKADNIVCSVPSGNFGNIGAGLLAWHMGLPIKQFIAATNENDIVPHYLQTGTYGPKPSVATLSNAMDVGNPSNWPRIEALFGKDVEKLKTVVTSYSFTDPETLAAIQHLYQQYNYIACPHTAVAWLGLDKWKKTSGGLPYTGLFLSTAHPCKFPEVFTDIIDGEVPVPETVALLQDKGKVYFSLRPDFVAFKNYLLAGC